MRLFCFLLCFPAWAFAQNCTFDFSNEGWTADGDAENGAAVWQATGGTPGGYVRTVDGSSGGTWYFVAPDKFEGIKCDAYGRFLRYDQFTSNNSNPNNRPDVELKGGGLTLVFDNPVLPGTSWTHFDILLREDAGWRLNNLNGATPTQAQFKTVLANVTGLRIRGEYFSQADDFGGLDNVNLESDFQFEFDLDGDDSSGADNGDFQAPATCIPTGGVIDADAVLNTNARIDSITISITAGITLEELLVNGGAGNISIVRYGPRAITLINNGNATTADFIALLQLIQYQDNNPEPKSGIRIIRIEVFTDCGEVGDTHRAYLPIFLQPYAGLDGDTVLCFNSGPMDLRTVLRDDPDPNGSWEPLLKSGGNIFDPNLDSAGIYTYIVPTSEPCAGDTARVRVRIEYPFELQPDTTLCYDEVVYIERPPGLVDWEWSTGSRQSKLPVREPGVYTLIGSTYYCTFSDSVAVGFITCVECKPYPPNVFSPNDDGENDQWHIFLQCRWSDYHLEVYDRWGSMVFASDDPEAEWDGRVRGKEALNGVYVWRMFWSGEFLGEPKSWFYEGDVTIVR